MSDVQHILALDIGGTKIASALVTLSCHDAPVVSLRGRIPTEAQRGGAHVLQAAISSLQRIVEQSDVALDGIGVSTGGVVDPLHGTITYANEMMPGWTGTQLGYELETAFGIPARIMNDVHAHAFGEALWGAGKGSQSAFVCAIGTGIGGAFVERGQLLLGAHGAATNIGHISCSDAAGIPCSCGAVGHVESVAAGPAIVEYYLACGGSSLTQDHKPIDGRFISEAAEAGDSAARAAEERSAHALGEALASMANLFDPACIILSGSVALCGPVWHEALRAAWSQYVMPPQAQTPIKLGCLSDDAPLIGAATNVVHSAYEYLQ